MKTINTIKMRRSKKRIVKRQTPADRYYQAIDLDHSIDPMQFDARSIGPQQLIPSFEPGSYKMRPANLHRTRINSVHNYIRARMSMDRHQRSLRETIGDLFNAASIRIENPKVTRENLFIADELLCAIESILRDPMKARNIRRAFRRPICGGILESKEGTLAVIVNYQDRIGQMLFPMLEV